MVNRISNAKQSSIELRCVRIPPYFGIISSLFCELTVAGNVDGKNLRVHGGFTPYPQ